MVPKLLDRVNPMICNLFLTEILKVADSVVLRQISSLGVEMFQIAAHDAVSQLHISQGFALLNIWKKKDPPARDSDESILKVSVKDENPWMEGAMLSESDNFGDHKHEGTRR